jgi:valyl-tRNA synthetase
MATELPKQYEPQAAQERWLAYWVEQGFFHSRPDASRDPYTIVIPPPNVTGALHMGHALNNTLQDVLIRWRRMQGYNALWMPGTDHAGIATQAQVEREIWRLEKKTRRDLGRDQLVKRIWQWKDHYEARILGQLKRLGASCDWQRTRFTMDEGCSRAVRVTFFNWFRDKYIYRGKRLVNWDPQLQTSVADDETYSDDIKGGFWTFRYPVKDSDESIRFSTTRPETMLGDTAICVHPHDDRYRHLIGRYAVIPLNGREIPIIADGLLADPTLGTGVVKVTPAHDPNDYQCGLRHKLPMINILNPDGTINENGAPFAGLDRYKAREAVTAKMEELGYFDGREDRVIPLKFSDRSKTPIEPYLSDQWFVRMDDRDDGRPGLAQMAMDAVTDGRVRFFPERYAKTYLDWLGEKRDWCISRQLWWGHRIPVWYAQCPEAVLHETFKERDDVCWQLDDENGRWLICSLTDLAPDALGPKYTIEQDPDVLDTWFSSQLWPHSTLGWPDATPELSYYYPTNTLVTTRDIITLWVARMVLSGLYNMNNVPFSQVYITPKLLDGFGVTMSKSKGNGVDPLDIIDRYGADALRYQMVFLAGETQDCRMPVSNVCPHCDAFIGVTKQNMDPDIEKRPKKATCPNCKQAFRPGGPWTTEDPNLKTAKQASKDFEVGRNFANKLWNAARFLLLNLDGYRPEAIRFESLPTEDRWILSRLRETTLTVTQRLGEFRFSDVARTIYDFTWSEFCDWYVEMSKGRLKDEGARLLAQRVLVGVLDAILRLIHPIMPFVTESIWHALNEAAFERGLPAPEPATESIMVAPWPEFPEAWADPTTERRVARMKEVIRYVREIRNQYMVDERKSLDLFVRCRQEFADDIQSLMPFVRQLASVGALTCGPNVTKPGQSASRVTDEFDLYVSLVGLIDPVKERSRLEKQIAEKRKALEAARAKLANEGFVARAPADVVQQQREAADDLEKQIAALEVNIRDLE